MHIIEFVGSRSRDRATQESRSSGKLHFWALLGVLVGSAVLCIGRFEAARLTTHVLRSPCTILSSEVVDVGKCSVCDNRDSPTCEVHPVVLARVYVDYRPMHSNKNTTGTVWYCKGRDTVNPCVQRLQLLDQLFLDFQQYGRILPVATGSNIACTAGEIFTYMQLRGVTEGAERDCYYGSRDTNGDDVWLSMPSAGFVDHSWFERHLEYPLLLALGGLVLLSVLLGCLALEGVELWASGLL
eukprot:TRINITY_DN76103_c0_g1_i1.p1 TRINITY_DN76103_c0_g1~~TRINITY_DN76103_c0_g1_i1.p1  ORF type:complete len:241 (+),score=30.04 TRINITY_DN76103_c0_g1_i1:143-865(+)